MLRTITTTTTTKKFLVMLFLATLCIGIYSSLKYTFHISVVEADFSDSAMLWLGWHQYGWKFFKAWHYTSDNWLLSLVPIHFMLFYLFGAKPIFVVLTGWSIFILSLVLLGLIAKKVEAPKTALLLPIVLLFFGPLAYSNISLIYAITHNITNLYGLLTLLMAIFWLQQERIRYLIIAFFSLVFAGVSDPWLLAAYLYPLLFASLIMLALFKTRCSVKKYLALILISLLAFSAIHTRMFHLLHFLSQFDLELSAPSVMLQNTNCLFRLIGETFNIIPDTFLPSSYAIVISSSIFCLLFLCCLYVIAKKLAAIKKEPSHLFLVLVSLASIGAIFLSFIVTFAKNDNGGRYLINFVFLAPLLIALNLEWFATRKLKYLAYCTTILFFVTSISSNVTLWKNQPLSVNANTVQSLMTFLNTNHLSQGYGPYWGSQANAITWMSHETIRFYPVMFSPENGHIILGERSQTSKLWKYFDNQKPFFIFVSNDGEECKDMKLCAQGIENQFGKPTKILSYQNAFIYIWQHEDHKV